MILLNVITYGSIRKFSMSKGLQKFYKLIGFDVIAYRLKNTTNK